MNSKGNMFDATEELPINIFNCASVSYLWTGFNVVAGEELYGSQGYMVEIYEDRVVVRGRDFVNGLWISSAQYCIETEAEGDCQHEMETLRISYKNGYLQSGRRTDKCSLCGLTAVEEIAPIFTFSGYSVRTVGSAAVCVGYSVDFTMLSIYEKFTGKAITVGFTAAAYDNLLVEGKPVNADGTTCGTTSGKIVNYIVERTYKHISLILNASNWETYADRRVILCAYYVEDEVVYYICQKDAVSDTVDYITYNELLAEQ